MHLTSFNFISRLYACLSLGVGLALVACQCPTEPNGKEDIPATNIVIEPGNFTISNNTTAVNGTLSATVYPTNHTEGELTINWASSDEDRLSLQSNSNTTASYGASFDGSNINEAVTVSAWVSGRTNLSNSIEVTLYHQDATNIVIDQGNFTISNNTTATNGTLSATVYPTDHTEGELTIDWDSPDGRLSVQRNTDTTASYGASFDDSNINEAVTVTAWVSGKSHLSNSIEITLYHQDATNIVIDQGNFTISNNTDATNGTLSATVYPTDHTDGEIIINWASSDEDRLSIQSNSNTTASYGASFFDGSNISDVVTVHAWVSGEPHLSNSIEITLYHQNPINILLDRGDFAISQGDQLSGTLTAMALPLGHTERIEWSSSDTNVLAITGTGSNGEYTAKSGGQSTLSVTAGPVGTNITITVNDWIGLGNAGWSARFSHTSVVFDNKMWVLGGLRSSGGFISLFNDVWWSVDGRNWSNANASDHWSARSGHSLVVFDDKIWVLGGLENVAISTTTNDVWWSVDGRNWSNANASNHWSARSGHRSVVFDDKIWVLGGVNNNNFRNDVWWSRDGRNWSNANASDHWSARAGHRSVVFDDKIWVIGGNIADNRTNDVWWSVDGRNWSNANASDHWPTRFAHSSVVFDDKIWVIGGRIADNRTNDVWWSRDGRNWSNANASDHWFARSAHSSVVFDNKIWVMGGASVREFNDVWFYWGD